MAIMNSWLHSYYIDMPYIRLPLVNDIQSDNLSPSQHFVLSITYLMLRLLTCIWEVLVCLVSSVGIAPRYGDWMPGGGGGGAWFSAPVQTGPGAHPASYAMGTGSFPEVILPGRGVDHPPPVDHPPHLAPRLKKEYSSASNTPPGLRGLF
jgi:hypothetical protein